MPPWRIYETVENARTDVPLTDLMDDGGLDIFESVQSSNYFNFSLKGDKLQLVAGNYVGLVPLNRRVALLIEPRVARGNWLHIVGRSNARLRELPYLRAYSRSEPASRSVVEFLSRALILQLAHVDQMGLYRQYLPKQESTPFPRGRIMFGQSIRDTWSRGRMQALSVEFYHLSKDTPHNRLVRYALDLALRYVLSVSDIDQPFLARMTALENLFTEVPLDRSLTYLDKVLVSIQDKAIPDSRAYYVDICKTAVLIVQNSQLVPGLHGQEATLTFVVDMPKVFHDYCCTVLRDNSDRLGEGYVVRAEDGWKRLFDEPSPDSRRAEPDILIEDSSGKRVPFEVKYKERPSRVDVNQAIAYAVAYKSRRVALLCYSGRDAPPGWQFNGTVGGRVDVWTYHLDLGCTDLVALEAEFADDVRGFLVGELDSPASPVMTGQ